MLTQLLEPGQLVGRCRRRHRFADAEQPGNACHACGAVAAEDLAFDAGAGKFAYQGLGTGAQFFADGKARNFAVRIGEHQGVDVVCLALSRRTQGIVGTAEAIADAVDFSFHAGAGDMAQRFSGFQRRRCANTAQGQAEWMRVRLFERGGDAERFVEAAASDFDGTHIETRFGQGAGLVEDETIGAGQRLKRIGIDHQHATLGEHGHRASQR